MTFKTKKELIEALKKKSAAPVETKVDPKAEADAAAQAEADKKKKEEEAAAAEAAKKKAEEDAKACADKPKEEPVKKEDPSASPVSLESVNAKCDEMMKNMNMIMEALSVVLEGAGVDAPSPEDKPAAEAKEDPKKDPAHADAENVVEDATETQDDEKTEDEMLKELEKTIAEIDELEGA